MPDLFSPEFSVRTPAEAPPEPAPKKRRPAGAPAPASVAQTVKAIRDVMRKDAGIDGDAQRIAQLAWMLFLKLLDDREREDELIDDAYRSPLPERLRWRAWAEDPEGITGDALLAFVDTDLFPTLKALDGGTLRGALVRGVFEDSYNYMKSGTLLRQVANRLGGVDFTATADRHAFNDVYETILRELQSAGSAGEFYTPRAVTRFMTERVDPKLGETVLDPACGTGGFLIDALAHVEPHVTTPEARDTLGQSLRGTEKKQLPHVLATTNLVLHGIEAPRVTHGNSLARPLASYGPADRVDVILTNPPFGGVEEDGIEQNVPLAFRTRETADLFMALLLRLLKPGGRAAVVLPDGFLFGEGVKTRLKEALLAECDLHTVVRLPNGVFAPYTNITTNLLFFEKGRPTRQTWFVQHPLPDGAKTYSKTRPIRHEEFAYLADWWADRRPTAFAWAVPAAEIAASGYNLDRTHPERAAAAATRSTGEILEALAARSAEVEALLADLRRALA